LSSIHSVALAERETLGKDVVKTLPSMNAKKSEGGNRGERDGGIPCIIGLIVSGAIPPQKLGGEVKNK